MHVSFYEWLIKNLKLKKMARNCKNVCFLLLEVVVINRMASLIAFLNARPGMISF